MPVDEIKPINVPEGAREALAKLEAAVEEREAPKPNLESRGPRNLPKPHAEKKVRLAQRESRRLNRPRKPTRRQRRRHVSGTGSSRPEGR